MIPDVLLSGLRRFLGFENDLGHGLLLGMSDGKMGADCPKLLKEFCRLAVKHHRGPSTGGALDFDVLPGDAPAPTCSDGLHGRFFGGKASGVALRLIGLGFAVADFVGCKYPLQKSPAKALDGRLDAIDFCDVDAGSDDH